jgi:hypothetical protein
MNYYVPSWCDLLAMQAQNFADAPANAIAFYRAALSAFHAQAEAGDVASIGAEEDDERRARAATPLAIDRVKFGAPHEAASTREIEERAVRRA